MASLIGCCCRNRNTGGRHEAVMAKFLMVYYGRSMPKANDEIPHEMVRWGDRMDSLGSQLIEPGAPVGNQ